MIKTQKIISTYIRTFVFSIYQQYYSSFFQNEEVFVKLDELDKFYRITHAWTGFNYSLTQA